MAGCEKRTTSDAKPRGVRIAACSSATNGTLTTIATTNGPLDSFFSRPSLNDRGAVAFHASFDVGAQAIFKGSGGALTTVATGAGRYFTFNFGGPSINVRGRVAFPATFDTFEEGIFTDPILSPTGADCARGRL